LNRGEFENDADGQYKKAQDEKRYINLILPLIAKTGMAAHVIIDTGRNAVQGLRLDWGDWCNVNGAGFGVRPTSETGDALADAFVWVKPGGESDGTSDTTATRYDSFCGLSDGMSSSVSFYHDTNIYVAFKPAPEAGTWNQAYFEMLLKNASPAF